MILCMCATGKISYTIFIFYIYRGRILLIYYNPKQNYNDSNA